MNEPDPQSRTSLLPTPKYRWESQGPHKRSNATNQPVGRRMAHRRPKSERNGRALPLDCLGKAANSHLFVRKDLKYAL